MFFVVSELKVNFWYRLNRWKITFFGLVDSNLHLIDEIDLTCRSNLIMFLRIHFISFSDVQVV